LGWERAVLFEVVAGGATGGEEGWDIAWIANVSDWSVWFMGNCEVYLGRLFGWSAGDVCRRREPL
jgi:hypothetical protein